jgi:hypothetical protein
MGGRLHTILMGYRQAGDDQLKKEKTFLENAQARRKKKRGSSRMICCRLLEVDID